ncbi:cyclopropane fatty acyl phospholipid synthase [Patescibacteria group bacterium]|nr:cyclopropane fatty acyl phospholipid synthase [Patescibacteria group bacterium]
MQRAKDTLATIVAPLGITFNGPNPWDPHVHDQRVYERILGGWSLAAGESYMDGWWDVDDLPGLFERLTRHRFQARISYDMRSMFSLGRALIGNMQARARAFQVAHEHYDLGNDLYEAMLGPSMVYTCAYWADAETLTDAQYAKLDLVARKVGLKPGDSVLDIGCGFGSFAKLAAEKYGATVRGTSVSSAQCDYARTHTAGLPVEIVLEDYRDTTGSYDHIVSIGMFEAVGAKNFRTYMQKAHDLLKPGGLFVLHTIGQNTSTQVGDPWIDRYIFPNGVLPSVAQIGRALEGLFVLEDWHSFGPYYDRTLTAWWQNFDAAWAQLAPRYGERFYRMWRYYLLGCAGTFRARENQLWQVVLSKGGTREPYRAVR